MNQFFGLANQIAAILLFFMLGTSTFALANEESADEVTVIIPLQMDDSWLAEEGASDVRVYSRESPGSSIREVMAESIIEASPRQVFAVLSDYAAYLSFMPYLVESEIEKTQGGKTWLFQQLDFPWPISDRYYTIVLSNRADPQYQDSYAIIWDLSKEMPVKQGKGMRVMLNRGGWRISPTEQDQATKIIYYIHTDPGGALPDWVSNMANTIAVPRVIHALKERVRVISGAPFHTPLF